MIKRLLLASTALVALTAPAAADPIFTPLLTAAFTSLGVTGSIAGVSIASIAASIGTAVVTTAIGVGITLLFAPRPPKPENGQIPAQQPIPFRAWGLGTDRVPGSIMFKEEENGFLGMVVALLGHQISAFRGLYLNDDLVTVPITGDGFISGFVAPGADKRYNNNSITIDTRKGLSTETAFPTIIANFPDVWGTDYRGDHIASAAMVCAPAKSTDFQQIYPYEAPQPSFIVDMALVFDPRDPTQDPNNPSTWKFSDNAALGYLWFRCFSAYGSMMPYKTAILPTLDRWIEAANVADEEAALKSGGTERRYRVAGWMTTQQDRRTGEQTIRACFDGWSVDRGDGSIDIEAGRYYEPDVILTDDDILGWTGQRGVATKDRINRFTAKYKSPENGYTTVETDALDDLADQAKRPGPPRASQVDLGWVPSTGQASRLLKREFIRQSEMTRGSLTLRLSGINACYARRVRVQSNSIPRLGNIVIEVSRPVISLMTGTVTINYVGSGPEIDTYDPTTDESSPPPVPQRAVSVGLPIPANVSVVAEQNGSSVYLDVSWDLPLNNGNPYTGISYLVEYRLHDAGSGAPGQWVPQQFDNPTIGPSRVSVASAPVPTGVILDVQVSSVATGRTLSTASPIVEVNTTLVAPGMPVWIAATGGTGTAALSVTNPSSNLFHAVQFYRAVHGGSFGSATAIGQPIVGTSGGTSSYTDTVPAGTYDYYATTLSNGGTASAPAGPETATVT